MVKDRLFTATIEPVPVPTACTLESFTDVITPLELFSVDIQSRNELGWAQDSPRDIYVIVI